MKIYCYLNLGILKNMKINLDGYICMVCVWSTADMFSVGKKGSDFDSPEMMKHYIHMLFAVFRNLKHELPHEISNNVVCATSKGSEQPELLLDA